MERAYRNGNASVNAGWYRVQRQMLDHPLVGAGSLGKYSRFEAWHWLIKNAVYEEKIIRNRGEELTLNAGEVLAAFRFLAKQWKWTVGSVRYFLMQLECAKAITRRTTSHNTQAQIIRLANWEKYQVAQHETQTENSHKTSQHLNNIQDTKPFSGGVWKEKLNTAEKSAQHTATFENGALVVSQALREHWLPRFGGDSLRLQYALEQVAGYVQPNSHRPLVAQINSQLARIVGNRRDSDQRYAARNAQPLGKLVASGIRDTSETFAEMRARLVREGVITDNNGTTSEKPQ
jgi:hypothetical protein